MEAKHRVALITGAGQGMGLGIARRLAMEGHHVLINDLLEDRAADAATDIVAQGGQASAAAFDVTKIDLVRAKIGESEAAVGGIDILVNNAGNAGAPEQDMQQTDFKDTDPGEWGKYLAVNLNGVLNCTHAVLKGMCERGWGRIITISSEAGRMGLPIRVSLYGTAKAGGSHLMRHISHEVGAYGVTANVLTLGLMDNNVGGEWAESQVETIPMRRMGSPEDVGSAVAFLASDDAAWVTGQTLVLNGGSSTF